MTTYYLSKYALTYGVETVEGDAQPDQNNFVGVRDHFWPYRLGKDIHKTEAEAISAAEAIRAKRIASLKKQLAKLEAMTFKVKEPQQ